MDQCNGLLEERGRLEGRGLPMKYGGGQFLIFPSTHETNVGLKLVWKTNIIPKLVSLAAAMMHTFTSIGTFRIKMNS